MFHYLSRSLTVSHRLTQKSLGTISFTADIWGDKSLQPYLALTAHWIENDNRGGLQLRSALIGFHRVRGNHTGLVLARVILYLLDRAQITMKVSSGSTQVDYVF